MTRISQVLFDALVLFNLTIFTSICAQIHTRKKGKTMSTHGKIKTLLQSNNFSAYDYNHKGKNI